MLSAVLLVFLCGCSTQRDDGPAVYTELSQLAGKRIGQVFEELLRQILLPEHGTRYIRFLAEYSEAEENAVVTVLHDGETPDLEKPENRMSAAIIQNAVTSIECRTVPDAEPGNRLRFLLKKT